MIKIGDRVRTIEGRLGTVSGYEPGTAKPYKVHVRNHIRNAYAGLELQVLPKVALSVV